MMVSGGRKKIAEGGRRTISDATVATVGFEENLYGTCYSCTRQCSLLTPLTFYLGRKGKQTVDTLVVCFSYVSGRLEFFHFLFFVLLFQCMVNAIKTYCDGINGTLVMEEKRK